MRRLTLFYRTVEKLDKLGCKMVINIMPNQPYHKSLIEKETNYTERMKNFRLYLDFLASKFPGIIIIQDNSDISNFGGEENHFFDHIHPTSYNSDLMIESFRDKLEEHAF